MATNLFILLLALLFDMLVGDPDRVWRKIPHPIRGFGAAISFSERYFNKADHSPDRQRQWGVFTIIILLVVAIFFAVFVKKILIFLAPFWPPSGLIIEGVIVSVFIAQKSLSDHVKRIIRPLVRDDLNSAQLGVSMIVGRDVDKLDQSAISRASIESLAENFSDGVLAPAMWYAIFGLPGLLAYKMLNTADSMIGHKGVRYQYFGWASAKLDDIANWLPARLSAFIIILAAFILSGSKAAMRGGKTVLKDAKKHRSPNAGWPESAMAGVLDVSLAGPRTYKDFHVTDPYINASGRDKLSVNDLKSADRLFWAACWANVLLLVILLSFFLGYI